MKKVFNLVFTIFLFYFSFYYTNIVSKYVKNKDPIMIRIKEIEKNYQEEPANATIFENTIIPGKNGRKVDIDASYFKMKKVNSFKESMLVFQSIKPMISLKNNLNKLIISGNKKEAKVSVLVKVNDLKLLKEILMRKNLKNISFIFEVAFLKENEDFIKNLDNTILVHENNDLLGIETMVDYCYTTNLNSMNNCINYHKSTVFSNIITHDYYYNTYKIIENGRILSYNLVNQKNISELNILINGIENLNYKVIFLEELLLE